MDNDILYHYVMTDNQEEQEELLTLIVAYWVDLFIQEYYAFARDNNVNIDEVDIQAVTADYEVYLTDILEGMRKRAREYAIELEDEPDNMIYLLTIDYIDAQYERIEDSESGNVIQLAQLLVANEFEKENPNAKVMKEWVAYPDCCPICAKLNGTIIPIDEPFLVAGQRVDTEDGETFIYKYVDRFVAIAHPNDRCRIQFHLYL